MGISCAMTMERLEERAFLSSVSGIVYSDLNLVGAHEGAGAPLAGLRVFVDRNGNGSLDEGEESAITAPDGTYSFNDLAPGPATIRVADDGWSHSLAPDEIVLEDEGEMSQDLFLYRSKLVRGKIFYDMNSDGVHDADEAWFANIYVFGGAFDTIESSVSYPIGYNFVRLDVANPAPRIWQQVGDDGSFALHIPLKSFGDLQIEAPGLWKITTNDHDDDLEIGLGVRILPSTGIIKGRVFDDANGNGVMDAGEAVVAGANVAINGAATGFILTDAAGAFEFTGMPAGQLGVRVISGPDVQLDLEILPVSVGVDETRIVDVPVKLFGSVWGLVLQRRKGHSPLTTYGVGVYLDSNNNGQQDEGELTASSAGGGEYFFTHVPAGNFTVRLRELPAQTRLVSALPSGTAVRGSDVEVATIFLQRPQVKKTPKPLKDIPRCDVKAADVRRAHLFCTPSPVKAPRKRLSPMVPRSLADQVDQSVWDAIQVHFHPGRFPLIGYVSNGQSSRFDANDNLQVDIETFGRSTPHAAELRAMNMAVGAVVDMHNYRVIEAWASVSQIRKLAKLSWVRRISLPSYGFHNPGSGPLAVVKAGKFQDRIVMPHRA